MANLSGYNTRLETFTKCNGHCAYCGKEITLKDFTIDHILPVSLRSDNRLVNFFPACSGCNKSKSVLSVKEFKKKIAIIEQEEIHFYFEREEFKEKLAEEIAIASTVLDEDYLLDQVQVLKAALKHQSKQLIKMNKTMLVHAENAVLKEQLKRYKAHIKNGIDNDYMLTKMSQRAELDHDFLERVKEVVVEYGNIEFLHVFLEEHRKYNAQVENLLKSDVNGEPIENIDSSFTITAN